MRCVRRYQLKIQINDASLILTEVETKTITVTQLFTYLDKPLVGSAVAINQHIISRSEWDNYLINEGDNISLFQAIAGG